MLNLFNFSCFVSILPSTIKDALYIKINTAILSISNPLPATKLWLDKNCRHIRYTQKPLSRDGFEVFFPDAEKNENNDYIQ